MKVNHKDFSSFNYISNECKNPFQLGDVVIYTKEMGGKDIGVVLQIHDDNSLRVDSDGNLDIEYQDVRLATFEEICALRNSILQYVVEFASDGESFRVTNLLSNSLYGYINADDITKAKSIATVKTELQKHYKGIETIGFGADEDYVKAAEIFLSIVEKNF
jgi:hypothetical protein